MYSKAIKLALSILLLGNPVIAQQRVEKIDILEGQKTYKNYVKNPSAIKNTNGTSVSSAAIARDTDAADKLDGIASFSCDASAQNGYCLWQVNTINEGDKTGNCEVSATFKGDASLYSLRLTDGANVIYDLPLKNQADWGGASFNYPCGATRDVRLVQTTAGTAPAVNIGRIYYGPATNLVNATADIYLGQIATTGSWTTNTTYTGHYWRVGDRLRAQVKVATTGAPTAASLTVNLPSGLSIDTAKGSYSYVDSPLGSASYYFTGSTSTKYFNGETLYNSTTSVALIVGGHEASGGSNVPSLHRTTFTSSTFPFTFANGDYIIFNYEVPIVGWTSSSMAVIPSLPSAPTIQRFTSGSGTYTTPQGVKYIKVTMAGGGGGGGAAGTATPANAATAGGNTTFGSSLLTAAGGSGATWSGAAGGGGGNPTVNSPAIAVKSLGGGVGQGGLYVAASTTQPNGAMGGANAFGGAGYGVSSGGNNGGDARANTGGGGGGGSANGANTAQSGGGGGAGAYIEAIIHNPSSTYSYAVGAAGTAANGSLSNGGTGGGGAAGIIIVEEYYHAENAPILVGSVTSGTSGAERIERVSFGGNSNPSNCTSTPCTIYSQTGSFASTVTRSGVGLYTVNFSGNFSSSPACTCSSFDSSPSRTFCGIYQKSISSISINVGASSGDKDSLVDVICMGPK